MKIRSLHLTDDVTRDLALIPNQVTAVEENNALGVNNFVLDDSPPQLQSFKLDLTENSIDVVFNEPIDTEAILLSQISIGISATTRIVALTDANVTTTDIGDAVSVSLNLAPETIVVLKSSSDIATDSTNTFLIINQNAITDLASNSASQTESRAADEVLADTTNPLLIRFVLNLESASLELTFDDVVDPSAFDPRGITLQGSQFRVDSGAYYTLSTASTSLTTNSGFFLNVSLSTDAQVIRENPDIGTNRDDTYITMLASTIDSPSGMDNTAITDGKALRAANVLFDSQPPMLEGFDLDLDEGEMVLSFNDFIDEETVELTEIEIQDKLLATPGVMYRLTETSTFTVVLDKLTIMLSNTDLDGIKSIQDLATSTSNTFLTASSLALKDISGIELVPVLDGEAEPVTQFVPDTTRPRVESFVLDLDGAIISIAFDEIIDITSVDLSQISLQSEADSNAESVTLLGSEPAGDTNTNELEVRLPIDTLREFSDNFGSMRSNTYLILTLFAVSDLNGSPVQQISTSSGLMASAVIPDQNPPTLEAFDLNLSESLLILTWSKPVIDDSLAFAKLRIQNMASSPTLTLQLSSESITGGEDGSVIEVMLTYDDSTYLKETSNIADSRDSTFISVESEAVNGALENRESSEIPIDDALQVKLFTRDEQPPRILSFELDLNANTLVITFDERLIEPVNPLQFSSKILKM